MATIGVYGATGYTGQYVARWLTIRGHRPVLAGRDKSRLKTVAAGLQVEPDVVAVDLHDADGLRAFAARCDGLIHCAGPFSRYGMPLVNAAIEARTPYVDHASQPQFVRQVTKDFDDRARRAGVTLVPALSFFTAIADLIAQSCAVPDQDLRGVAVAYHVDGWRPTPGTLITGGDLARQRRVVFSDNECRTELPPIRRRIDTFEFPAPLGWQPVVAGYAGCCAPVTIPKHTATCEVQTFASVATFSDAAFTQKQQPVAPLHTAERGSDAFVITVETDLGTARRRAWVKGVGDIYDLGALISVLGVERLVAGAVMQTGVLGPAEAFGDCGLLEEICQSGFIENGLHVDELLIPDMATD